MNYKVSCNIGMKMQEKIVFVRDVDTKEEARLEAKRYFILERPEMDFMGVKEIVEI